MTAVEWDRDKFERFKQALKRAQLTEDGTFWFEGNEYVAGYAMYLAEYLERRFAQSKGNEQ